MPQPRRVGIAEVARQAGVSTTAVSFAFNRPENLGDDTVAKIHEVAADLGYRPHPVARMLTARETATIGVLTPHSFEKVFGNPFFALFFEGVASVIGERDLGLLFIAPIGGSLKHAIDRATVDGVMVLGLDQYDPEVNGIRRAGVPIVSVDAPSWPEHAAVQVADDVGARYAAEHLAALGHRDILIMAIGPYRVGPRGAPGQVVRRRLRGYRAGLALAGGIKSGWVVEADSTIESGAAEFVRSWDAGYRPTAVLAMSDAIAVGVLQAAKSLGLQVPGDLSIVGFDDLPMSRICEPALTTVHQPVREKGQEAARLLLAAIHGGAKARSARRLLKAHLVIRESTSAPRTQAK